MSFSARLREALASKVKEEKEASSKAAGSPLEEEDASLWDTPASCRRFGGPKSEKEGAPGEL